MQDPRQAVDAWVSQQASMMGNSPHGLTHNRAIAQNHAPSQVGLELDPGAGTPLAQPQTLPLQAIAAMIQGAKAGDQAAYAQGIQAGIFDTRLSPAAAAWQAEIKMGGTPQGAPSSILKELADFQKLQVQETALSDLLPEASMQGPF